MDEQTAARAATTFEELAERSVESLTIKLELHRWWLENYDEWNLQQDDGTLVVRTSPRGEPIEARAPAQIIGSFNRLDGTWLWAWDNPSIAESLKRDARRVKQFGEEKSFTELTTPKVATDLQGALRFAAIASHVCAAQGVFSAAIGETYLYINFGEVKLQKSQAPSGALAKKPSGNRRLKLLLLLLAALFILPIVGAVFAIAMGR
jgi:hypothetical protein